MSPSQLEAEIKAGVPVIVVDVRGESDFATWHLTTDGVRLVNGPAAALAADPRAALAGLPALPLRVICARGRASVAAVTALNEAGISATNVTGGMIAWSRLLVAEVVDIGTATTVLQLRREARGCLSYLIASDGEALVVDPAPSIEPYVAVAIEVNGQPDSIHPLTTAVTGDQIEVIVTVASTRAAPDLLQFVGYSITGQTLRASFTLRKE